MSGRKTSQVELANNVKQAISCRIAAEESYARAESLVKALNAAAKTSDPLEAIAASAEETLREIGRELESFNDSFTESRMMQSTVSQVQKQRQRVEQLRARVEQIAHQCREGNNASARRAELIALLDQVLTNRNQLETWLRIEYNPFIEETRSLIEQVDREMARTGTVSSFVGEIQERVTKFDGLMKTAVERRESDANRQYVAKALKKVCEDMAFSVEVLPQRDPIDDLVLEVNTHAYGILHFRLELDGDIRSNSELVESSCCANFGLIEDGLRSLGVNSQFRYEDDQRPVFIRKGEKPLPGSEPEVTAGRTS